MLSSEDLLLQVKNLKMFFPIQKGVLRKVVGHVRAVDDVSLDIRHGETFSLVGESGCGKTTIGRAILRLIRPTAGEVIFQSKKLAAAGQKYREIDVAAASKEELKKLRQDMQIVFQDPYSTLNPRMKVEEIIGEPLLVHGIGTSAERKKRVGTLLEEVGLKPDFGRRYPHEFSGGQRQRICIARALALDPQLIVADEPVSALDVSVQAQVINLFKDLQKDLGLTYLFISHDLSVVKYISDRVAVVYLGRVVELAGSESLFASPRHPYTESLMSAVPVPDPEYEAEEVILEGDVPNPSDPPSGCHFHPRCPYRKEACSSEPPPYFEIDEGHFVACHLADKLDLRPVKTQ